MKITAALALAPHQPLSIEEVELTEDLAAHEILVKNVASGICHTDITFRDFPEGHPVIQRPCILGHEGAGIVQKVGSGVTSLQPGDHVIMSFGYDGTCPSCQANRQQYCESFLAYNFSGLRVDGTRTTHSENHREIGASYFQQSSFATWSVATENNAVKVPGDLPLEMLAPLGCGFMTGAGAVLNRLKPSPGSSIAVFGAGPLGFAAMYMAGKAGCTTIVALDLHASRLKLAKEFGATHTINASECENPVQAILDICPTGVNYAYEATGSAFVMSQAVEAIGPGGHCVLSGMVPDPEAKVQFTAATFITGKSITGISMGDADMRGTINRLIEAVKTGDFPVEKLITYYDFKDINRAIDDAEAGISLKSVVRMPAE